ncbi:Alpha/beta hydrolase fold protein [Candidatus Methylomirabilis lanthanidiphila]|uniref:Alpha/beta hydrolase fold protein n=1 Tax=Candidatus Methylomirabilis lanthanidiphila TaxID=2211376 RepID=A0A564ZHC8_9BACT|nr:alpha/beta hydrolase [Candidatus Methylomirabilis lanthanidiphila]VUZ84740.1 Alpha/beta hydrolase fold protein [Candidatus Methylomirabilis lanthanidiphila]
MNQWLRIGMICRMAVAVVAISTSAAGAVEQGNAIVKEEFLVQGKDQGVKLFVREKRLANLPKIAKENVVLFVHGIPGPGSVIFDLAVPGYSWLEYAAERGFDAFTLDIRGFGRSTRPTEMKELPYQNLPIVRTDQVMRDLDVAVDFIRSKRKVEKVNIIGYSIGASWSALYATLHPEKVGKLVMYGAIYGRNSTFVSAFGDPTNPDRPNLEMGAYRYLGRKELLDQWDGWIKLELQDEWRDREVIDAWIDALLGSDPTAKQRSPESVQVPNGPYIDWHEIHAGRSLFDPARIKAPTMIVRGSAEELITNEAADELLQRLTSAPSKRRLDIGDSTHYAVLEKNRLQLYRGVQNFLEE